MQSTWTSWCQVFPEKTSKYKGKKYSGFPQYFEKRTHEISADLSVRPEHWDSEVCRLTYGWLRAANPLGNWANLYFCVNGGQRAILLHFWKHTSTESDLLDIFFTLASIHGILQGVFCDIFDRIFFVQLQYADQWRYFLVSGGGIVRLVFVQNGLK